eukprot:scaffold108882_cov24-Tisochrysis_lutea.AAC.1
MACALVLAFSADHCAQKPIPQRTKVHTSLLTRLTEVCICISLTQAFKTMALKKHPDKNKNNPAAGVQIVVFCRVNLLLIPGSS